MAAGYGNYISDATVPFVYGVKADYFTDCNIGLFTDYRGESRNLRKGGVPSPLPFSLLSSPH